MIPPPALQCDVAIFQLKRHIDELMIGNYRKMFKSHPRHYRDIKHEEQGMGLRQVVG